MVPFANCRWSDNLLRQHFEVFFAIELYRKVIKIGRREKRVTSDEVPDMLPSVQFIEIVFVSVTEGTECRGMKATKWKIIAISLSNLFVLVHS
jgi:hypothetical protein